MAEPSVVREWCDEAENRFRVEVRIANAVWGDILGYEGWFRLASRACPPEAMPADVRPTRENPKD